MQDKVYEYDDFKNSEIDYLNKRNNASLIIYNIVIISILISILSLPFIYVDIAVRSPAEIKSFFTKEDVNSTSSGFIRQLKISDNQAVKQGDALFQIDVSTLNNEIHLTRERQRVLEDELEDINTLLSINKDKVPKLRTSKYQVEYANLQEQLSDALNKVTFAEKDYNRFKKLFDSKVITQVEWEDHDLKYKQSKAEYSMILKRFQSTCQSDESQIKLESYNNKQQILQNKDLTGKSVVKAHIRGTIYKSSQIQEGSFVQIGQKIAEISPDSNLIAVCYLDPNDMGFIHMNQDIRLQVSAYNYTEWGYLTAKVFDISKDPVLLENKNYAFNVKAKLDRNFLKLKNGYKAYVTKGMTANASFFIVKRSLWQLLYDSANDWLNPKQKNK